MKLKYRMRSIRDKIQIWISAAFWCGVVGAVTIYLYLEYLQTTSELRCFAGPGGWACSNWLVGLLSFAIMAIALILGWAWSKARE